MDQGQKFDYLKLREIQNIQWAQDAVIAGDQMQDRANTLHSTSSNHNLVADMSNADQQAAITQQQQQQMLAQCQLLMKDAMECYQTAIDLDGMNKEAWQRKGLLLKTQQF